MHFLEVHWINWQTLAFRSVSDRSPALEVNVPVGGLRGTPKGRSIACSRLPTAVAALGRESDGRHTQYHEREGPCDPPVKNTANLGISAGKVCILLTLECRPFFQLRLWSLELRPFFYLRLAGVTLLNHGHEGYWDEHGC